MLGELLHSQYYPHSFIDLSESPSACPRNLFKESPSVNCDNLRSHKH